MSEPIVFTSHFRVKAGKAEAYKRLQHEIAKQLQSDKPRTLVFLAYLTENDTEMSVVHVFGDADIHDATCSRLGRTVDGGLRISRA